MPMTEIDQANLDTLTKVNALFNELLDGKDTGLHVKKMIKQIHPDAKIRDLDLIEAVTAPYDAKLAAATAQMEALQRSIDEDRQSRENEKAETALRSSLARIRKDYGFTDEGMSKVIELAKDRNLAHDMEAAAALVKQAMPKAAPTSARSSLLPQRLDIFGMQSPGDSVDEKWKQLHTQPWAFLEDECIRVIDEFNAEAAA